MLFVNHISRFTEADEQKALSYEISTNEKFSYLARYNTVGTTNDVSIADIHMDEHSSLFLNG